MSAVGIAGTVMWTELHAAMEADGMSVSGVCSKHISAWIDKTARDYIEAATALATTDTNALVKHLAERGQCYEVLKELCGVFGVELYASEQVRNMLEAKVVISDTTRELIRQLIERDRHGLAKYGTTLDRTDLDRNAWLQHLAEELMDGAGYALAAKRT